MKKLFKVLIWIGSIFVALILLLWIGFELFFPTEKVRELAIEQGRERLGRDVSVGSIDLSIWGGLGLKLGDVSVNNPDSVEGTLLKAGNIDLKLELLPLLSGEYRIDRLVINSPDINMIKFADGTNNYTFSKLEQQMATPATKNLSAEAKAAGFAVSFKKLEIVDGHITYRNDVTGRFNELSGIDLATALENPEDGLFLSDGELQIASANLFADIYPPVKIQLNYGAAYNLKVGELDIEKADLVVDKLAFEINGRYRSQGESSAGQFFVKSHDTNISELVGALPDDWKKPIEAMKLSGKLDIDLDLILDDNRDPSISYAGALKLNGVKLAHDSVPGEIQFTRAVLDIKPDNARLNIEDGTFDGRPLKGQLTVDHFANPSVAGELAGSLNLAFVTPFMPEGAVENLEGLAEFDLIFSGQTENIKATRFSGHLAISNGEFASSDLPESLDSIQFDAYFDNDVTRIDKLSGRMNSGSFSFSGRVNDLPAYLLADSTENVKLALSGNFKSNLNLDFFERYLPEEGHPDLAGTISLNLSLDGSTAAPERIVKIGELKIANASYNDDFLPEKLQHLETDMTLTPDTVTVSKLAAAFESSNVLFTGKLADPFPYLLPIENLDRSRMRKPLFIFELSSTLLNVDRLFPEAAPGTGVNRATLPQDSVSMILLPDIDGRGKFSIDTVIYAEIEFTSLTGDVKIYDRKIECYNVTGNVYTGIVAGNTTIDLNNFENPVYSGEYSAKDVEANDFISRFSEFGGHLFGKINLQGSYTARGWEPEQFLNSLTMNSDANMLGGKIVTSGEIQSTINGLASRLGESFDSEQAIKQLATKVMVKDGKVLLDNLKTKLGEVGDVDVGGSYSFTGNLDYKGSILLSKAWTEKLSSKLFGRKTVDRVKLPIVINGSADKPAMNIDYDILGDALGDKIKGEAENLLKGLFKK